MNIKEQRVSNQFNASNVKQIDSKNLYIVSIADLNDLSNQYPHKLLVSYWTIVGILKNGYWILTSKKYSRTTSTQLTYIRKALPCAHGSKIVDDLVNYMPDRLRSIYLKNAD